MKFISDPVKHPVRFWASVSGTFVTSIAIMVVMWASFTPASPQPSGEFHPDTVWEVGGPDLAPYTLHWVRAATRRYPDEPFILIFVHGETHREYDECGEIVSEQWYAYPDRSRGAPMVEIILRLRERYGEHRVVIVSCNPDGITLDLPRVTYALDNVWVIPDSELSVLDNAARDYYGYGDLPGRIEDFIETDGE